VSEGHTNRNDLYDKATRLGLDVVEPQDDEVFVDLDCSHDQYIMEANLALLREKGLDIRLVNITRSVNGNRHAYIKTGFCLTDIQRVALQAILGSDRKREALAFVNIVAGVEPVSVFFEKPAL
jgi:hypothetical protein